MTDIFVYGLPVVFALLLCCYMAYRAGRSDGAAEQKDLEDIKDRDAHIVEDRLRRDTDYAGRLRKRFTR